MPQTSKYIFSSSSWGMDWNEGRCQWQPWELVLWGTGPSGSQGCGSFQTGALSWGTAALTMTFTHCWSWFLYEDDWVTVTASGHQRVKQAVFGVPTTATWLQEGRVPGSGIGTKYKLNMFLPSRSCPVLTIFKTLISILLQLHKDKKAFPLLTLSRRAP